MGPSIGAAGYWMNRCALACVARASPAKTPNIRLLAGLLSADVEPNIFAVVVWVVVVELNECVRVVVLSSEIRPARSVGACVRVCVCVFWYCIETRVCQ